MDKKLNEIVANELLYSLKEQYKFDWIKDCVTVTFYANHEREADKIGCMHMIDSIGEVLLERYTVKAFKYGMSNNAYDNTLMFDIDIVLNM